MDHVFRFKSYEFIVVGTVCAVAVITMQIFVAVHIRRAHSMSRRLRPTEVARMEDAQKKAKTAVITLILLLITFLIAFIPWVAVSLITLNFTLLVKIIGQIGLDYYKLLYSITEVLLVSGAVLDPLIYGTRTVEIRQSMLLALKCRKRSGIYVSRQKVTTAHLPDTNFRTSGNMKY